MLDRWMDGWMDGRVNKMDGLDGWTNVEGLVLH